MRAALRALGTRRGRQTVVAPPASAGQGRYLNAPYCFWTQPLPDDVPLQANSQEIADHLYNSIDPAFGGGGSADPSEWWMRYYYWINRENYAHPVYETNASVPLQTVRLYRNASPWNDAANYITPATAWSDAEAALSVRLDRGISGGVGLRIPPGALPANTNPDYSDDGGGVDKHMIIVETDTRRLTEMWTCQYMTTPIQPGNYTGWVCHAATDIPDYLLSSGTAENWDAGKWPTWTWATYQEWRANATGPVMSGGDIYDSELISGTIPHALTFAIPGHLQSDWWDVVWPAKVRGDGTDSGPIKQSNRLRLPAGYDVDSLVSASGATNANFVLRTMAKAIRDFGMVLHDTTFGAYTFSWDPFGTYNFGDYFNNIMNGFPTQDLVTVDPSWRPPGLPGPDW